MGVDSSIYFQQQPVDIVGSIQKGLAMRDMADARKLQQTQLAEQQAVKKAYADNMSPDGNINEKGLTTTLGQLGQPKELMAYKTQNAAMKQADSANHAADLKNRIDELDLMGRHMRTVTDQPTYESAIGNLAKAGIDTTPFPKLHDPNFVKSIEGRSMSASDRLKLQMEMRKSLNDDKRLALDERKTKAMEGKAGSDKQGAAMQTTSSMLESARGNPAVAQAEKDLYAADKAKGLANLYGDPNKLNPAMVNLLVSEVGKIASGGVPSMHELEGLTPSTLTGKMASVYEKLTNEPSSANAGAFVQQYQDYADSLSKDAKKIIADKYGRVIESRKRLLHPNDYKALNDLYIGRFAEGDKGEAHAQAQVAPAISHPQASTAEQWAKQNPNDPRAMEIMKRLGR
jgi:hypothetical protein